MEQLFGSIPSILDQLGPNTAVEEQVVFGAWKRVAGEQLSERTKALAFLENRLIIAVENEMWRRHLETLAKEMLARLNGKLGHETVKFIEFRVEPAALKKSIRSANENKTVDEALPELVVAAAQIEDESLRQSFLDASSAYLANPRTG